MLLDQGAQSSLSGVLAPWPPADFVYSCSISLSSRYGFAGLRLHPQLVLNPALLAVAPHSQDFVVDQLHPLLGFALVALRVLLDLLDLELDLAYGSPVESRAQVARCI